MAGIVMVMFGTLILCVVVVYVGIRRQVQLRKAELSREYKLEQQVKELTERIRQLEGATTSEAVALISSFRLSGAGSSVARLLRHMEQRADALHFELGNLALQANAFIDLDAEDVRKNVEEHAKRIIAEEAVR
jgi:type II secretory pathway component PulM